MNNNIKTDTETTTCENPVIDLMAVTDADLATVTGGRNYGWSGGGWVNEGGGGLGNGGSLPGATGEGGMASVDGGNIGEG